MSAPSILRRARQRLALKIGLVVFLVLVSVFAAMGVWYNALMRSRDDADLLERLRSISQLFGRGLLSFDTMADANSMEKLLGEDLELALVAGANGIIFTATDPSLAGMPLGQVPGVRPEWFQQARDREFILSFDEPDGERLICITPLYTATGQAPFLHAFFRVHARRSEARKQEMTQLVLAAAVLGTLLTFVTLFLSLQHIIVHPLERIAGAVRRLERGELDARVPGPVSDDEIGVLQQGLNTMANSLAGTVQSLRQEVERRAQVEEELRQATDTLEQRVRERTMDLQELNRQLTREVDVRLKTESDLRESTAQIQGILDNSPSAIFLVDLAGRVLLHNDRFHALYDLEPIPVDGRLLADLLDPDTLRHKQAMEAPVLGRGLPVTYEETVSRGEGFSSRLVTAFPLRDAAGAVWAVCSIASDITDKKRLEAEAQRAGQLASIGELAASVAHEINNPITGIINYAQLLLDDCQDACHDMLEKIIVQSERIAAIVRSLLSYSRAEPERLGPVSLPTVVEDSMSMTRYRLKKAWVRVLLDLDPDLPPVVGRARELQQVCLNLLSNALHALQEKRARDNAAPLECHIRATLAPPGADGASPPMALLSVRDTGVGVPEAALGKVFLPFYTTKPSDKGTGLGLSISRAIVDGLGGQLRLQSVEGSHALVEVLLPLWRPDVKSRLENSANPA